MRQSVPIWSFGDFHKIRQDLFAKKNRIFTYFFGFGILVPTAVTAMYHEKSGLLSKYLGVTVQQPGSLSGLLANGGAV